MPRSSQPARAEPVRHDDQAGELFRGFLTAANAGGRGELREYPIDHLDAETGPGQQDALPDQLEFLRRHLAPTASRRAATTTTDWNHQ